MKKIIAASILLVILFGWRTVIANENAMVTPENANVWNTERSKTEYASVQECIEASKGGFLVKTDKAFHKGLNIFLYDEAVYYLNIEVTDITEHPYMYACSKFIPKYYSFHIYGDAQNNVQD